MSQLVKTKRQANFKGFKQFGVFKGLVEQKNVVFNSFVCKLGLFWHSWAFKTLVSLAFYSSSKLLLFFGFVIMFCKYIVTCNVNGIYLHVTICKII
jgi:hypothetical protein